MESVCAIVAGVALFGMMALTVVDVFLRYIFNAPLQGAYHIMEFLLVGLVFLAFAYVQRVKGHVGLTLVVEKLPPAVGLVLEILGAIVGIAVFSVTTWLSGIKFHEAWVTGDYVGEIVKVPYWPALLAITIGFGLLCLTLISRIIRDTQLSGRVKSLHVHRCQIMTCEQTIVLADGSHYAEAHHIRPLGKPHNGPDIMENILCLCPNHHAACDLGAIRLVAADLRKVAGHDIGQEYLNYHNHKIRPGKDDFTR